MTKLEGILRIKLYKDKFKMKYRIVNGLNRFRKDKKHFLILLHN
jgi:hypothetical protein